jgi:hypothetical protein
MDDNEWIGLVVLSRQQIPMKELPLIQAFKTSVEAIAHDLHNSRFAITSHDSDIHLYSQGKNGELKLIWKTLTTEPAILRAVYFVRNGTSIVAFALETGEMCVSK